MSKKKFVDLEASKSALELKYDQLSSDNSKCEDDKEKIKTQLENMKAQMQISEAQFQSDLNVKDEKLRIISEELEFNKKTSTNLLDRLSDLSVVNKAGAESIKQSLESLNQQSKYIQNLSQDAKRKDSLNLALVMNLKRSLADVNDSDIQVDVKKGVVFISISDKLLFQSGSATVNNAAKNVLAKVAKVVNDHNSFDIIVEGHTDDKLLKETASFKDNWELSVERATSVVRILQKDYNVDPSRMTAGGRGQYLPKADNETSEGRSMNRRTEIIVTPRLDEFFQLMAEPGAGK
ncbi:OmpA/MotB family protein [Portibacter lacus]|uniref:Flagellar motor protein MotB n=1 Tax=Portibacter lacus TaxID=1099794 RepID=A0AA37WD07_9BACT|nr:OmpA family protein [Portibacter lacus]GLR16318.1 flagellar motor protein MotB [Portibacter lacus]